MSKEAMKLALEALEMVDRDDNDRDFLFPSQCYQLDEAITALREALAEQPTQRTWVGLTEEEIEDAWQGLMATYIEEVDSSYWAGCDFEFARSIEAKLKEKNQ